MGVKFTYIVRQPEDPLETTVAGYRFRAGAETEVDHPAVIEMLSRNPWFLFDGAPKVTGALSRENRDPEPVIIQPKRRGRPPRVAA